jgi:SAM-dependent methyltransferase
VTADLYDHAALYDVLLPMGGDMRDHYVTLARRAGGPVLELACGSGQLTVPLADAGADVTGLDLSPAMLARAAARAGEAGARVELVEGDMRTFDIDRRFALVVLCRNSMLHLAETDDILSLFAAVRRHLTGDGVFAFDIFNPDPGRLARRPDDRQPLMTVDDSPFGRLDVDVTMAYDAATQVNHATWFVSTPTQRDAWTLPLDLRCIYPLELPLLLERGGLQLVSRHGGFDGRPFASASARQVCVTTARPDA